MQPQPHIALFPNSGMGHLMPYLRLASQLLRRGCSLTLITARPVVSAAESAHIASFLHRHPQVNAADLHLIISDHQSPAGPPQDPFFLQWDCICRSTHLLRPLLSSVSPPLSAIFADLIVAQEISLIATDLSIPLYLLSTTSTNFLSLMAHLPELASSESSTFTSEITVPGISSPLPVKSIPPPFFEPQKYLFTSLLLKSFKALSLSRGILMNTFEQFEQSTLAALNHHRVQQSLPAIIPIGPLQPIHDRSNVEDDVDSPIKEWLGQQEAKSVVLVSFGSRTAMSAEQIRELGDGLVRSGCNFIWVVKTSKVDRDDDVSGDDDDIKGLLGETLWEKTKEKGKVVRGWVEQAEILASPAIGGFLVHGGWNSVMEAAWFGVPMLVWPLHGDQRVNAKVVEDAGLGLWMQGWGMGNNGVVKGEEIGEKIIEMMKDERLREKADKVKQYAVEAVGVGGSSHNALVSVLQSISPTSSF